MRKVASRCDVFEHRTSGRQMVANMGILRDHLVRIGDWRLVVTNAVMPLYAADGIKARGYYVVDKVLAKSRGWYEKASQ